MRVGVTGHTGGLGKALYDHLVSCGHDVFGFSRSNGYTIPDNIEKIIDEISDFDLFINNCHVDITQATFIERLWGKIMIITSGSMASQFSDKVPEPYFKQKHHIQQIHEKYRRLTTKPMLMLRMGHLENQPEKLPIKYSEVTAAVDFWLRYPRVSLIEFENHPFIYLSHKK